MVNAAFFTSLIEDYGTPQWVFDVLNDEFHFDFDVCASAENAKCVRFFTKEINGLIQEWKGICWMNPPYGKHIRQWIEKARDAAKEGATVVCLLPARTNTKWWFEVVADAAEVRFIHPKLQFEGAKFVAPFPSAIVIFRAPSQK